MMWSEEREREEQKGQATKVTKGGRKGFRIHRLDEAEPLSLTIIPLLNIILYKTASSGFTLQRISCHIITFMI